MKRTAFGKLLLAAWAVGFIAACSSDFLQAQKKDVGPMRLESFGDLWADFDPEARPLDVEVIRTETHDGIDVQVLRYTSLMWNGKPIRIFARYGHPEGKGPFPGALYVHGGGGTASAAEVVDMVRRGYACLSFDWTGPRKKRKEYTDWPEGVGSSYAFGKENRLYHAVCAAMRGVTFLKRRPEVDGDRIGEFGISWGGYITWLLNAVETRLTCCVAIYGCGAIREPGHPPRTYTKAYEGRWRVLESNFEPQNAGPFQKAPILYLTGLNDFFGWPRAGTRLLKTVTVPSRQVFSPGINHGVDPQAARTAYAFFDRYLKGGGALVKSPALELSVDPKSDRLKATIAVDRPDEVEAVRLDYSLGEAHDPGRCWRFLSVDGDGAIRTAAVPVFDPDQPVVATAQVTYKDGYRLSSLLIEVTPSALGDVKATLEPKRTLGDFSKGLDGWSSDYQSVHLFGQKRALAIDPDGFEGKPCLKVVPLSEPSKNYRVNCWAPGDPQYRARGAKAFTLKVKGARKFMWFSAYKNYRYVGSQRFMARVKLPDDPDVWHTVTVSADAFEPTGKTKRTHKGVGPLDSFDGVQVIHIGGPSGENVEVRIADVRWVEE